MTTTVDEIVLPTHDEVPMEHDARPTPMEFDDDDDVPMEFINTDDDDDMTTLRSCDDDDMTTLRSCTPTVLRDCQLYQDDAIIDDDDDVGYVSDDEAINDETAFESVIADNSNQTEDAACSECQLSGSLEKEADQLEPTATAEISSQQQAAFHSPSTSDSRRQGNCDIF